MPHRKINRAQEQEEKRQALSAGDHVWAYLRHSPGDKQTIDSQRSAVREWCGQNGWVLDHEFIDEGVEGSKEQRERFQEMISLAKHTPRPVDGIVVWSFSRFARDLNDAQYYKALLRKLGYVILSKTDNIPDGPMGPMMEAFIDMNNQHFLDVLSADITRGLHYIVEHGFYSGGSVPLGYRVAREEMGRRPNGQMRYGNRLVKDEAMQERVALAWRMKIERNASTAEIHNATNLYNTASTYSFFFRNLIYAGVCVFAGKRYPSDWEQGAKFCEPYITLGEYNQVQLGMQQRSISMVAPRLLSTPYLLSGLLVCGNCARNGVRSPLTGSRSRNEHFNYRCRSQASPILQGCGISQIPSSILDQAVMTLLKDTVLTKDFLESVARSASEMSSDGAFSLKKRVEHAELLVKSEEKKLSSIVSLIETKGLNDYLSARYDDINQSWLDASKKLTDLRSQAAFGRKQFVPADIYAHLDDVVALLSDGPIQERREIVRTFIEQVTVYTDSIHVQFTFSIDSLSQAGQRKAESGASFKDYAFDSVPFRAHALPLTRGISASEPKLLSCWLITA